MLLVENNATIFSANHSQIATTSTTTSTTTSNSVLTNGIVTTPTLYFVEVHECPEIDNQFDGIYNFKDN